MNQSHETNITESEEHEYKSLLENLIDLVIENQAKLGYSKGSIRLYYPLSSLNHILNKKLNAIDMLQFLADFPKAVKEVYGIVKVSNDNERFCFYLGEDFSDYVYQNRAEDDFITKLVQLVGKHETSMQQIFDLFTSQKDECMIETIKDGEFDVAIHFLTGKDKYYYCFKDEGVHIIYHRFIPEDYQEIREA